MTDIPHWWMRGDWFDVCSCDITCPCEFAQPPTNNRCEGVLAYKVRKGAYGDVRLDGLNVLGIGQFTRQKENGARVRQKRSRRLSLPKVVEVLLFVQAPACIPTLMIRNGYDRAVGWAGDQNKDWADADRNFALFPP